MDCQFGWNLGESGGDHVANGLLQRLILAGLQTILVTFQPAIFDGPPDGPSGVLLALRNVRSW